MFSENRLNRTARWLIFAYMVLLFILLVGLVEVALLALSGYDPMTAVTTPWKLTAVNLMMVLAFIARYLRISALTLSEPVQKTQPTLDPVEIERERIERWARRW